MDSLFRIISVVVILGAAGAAALHAAMFRPWRRPSGGEAGVRRYGRWELLLHGVLAACFVVLALTGFWPSLLAGEPLSGWLLMIHTGAGGLFAAALAAMALTWAADNRYERHDWAWLRDRRASLRREGGVDAGRFDACQKTYFWAACVLGLAAILSIMVAMLDWFGPDGIAVLREVHRYACLALLAETILHGYLATIAKPGAWQALWTGRVSPEWAERYHPVWWRQRKGREQT